MKRRKLNISKIRESLLIGIKEIRYNKTRSFLTLFGIMLGVASLIAMMSITEGYKKNFIEFMDAFGGLARVSVNNLDSETLNELATLYDAKGITMADVDAIVADNSDIIEYISPQKGGGRFLIRQGNKSMRLWGQAVVGATSSFADINGLEMEYGRNISEFDDLLNSRVTVIGSIIRNEFFGEAGFTPGDNIAINGKYMTVVGSFKEYSANQTGKPAAGGSRTTSHRQAITAQDEAEHISGRDLWRKYGMSNPLWRKNMNIVVPISTFSMLFQPTERLSSIEIQFYDSEDIDGYVERVKSSMRRLRPGYEDFDISTSTELFAETQKQMRTMSLVFGAIAIISLLVGGIGIMNVILASISERIREIGVRKSVGARNADVFVQFLIETIVLAVMGGLLGVAAGSSISTLIARVAGMDTFVSPLAIMLALASSFAVGIVFGIYPSVKAAKLNPIDALRYE
jgi:putative ABC transport system permease protein